MPELDSPDLREIMLPGLTVRMLPDLEAEEDERPALIALFDKISEYHYLSGKKAFPSSLPIRLFVEALTILTLWERNGQIQSKHIRIKDIVETLATVEHGRLLSQRGDKGHGAAPGLRDAAQPSCPHAGRVVSSGGGAGNLQGPGLGP